MYICSEVTLGQSLVCVCFLELSTLIHTHTPAHSPLSPSLPIPYWVPIFSSSPQVLVGLPVRLPPPDASRPAFQPPLLSPRFYASP